MGLISFVALAIVLVRSVMMPSLQPDIESRIHADFAMEERQEVRRLLLGLPNIANLARVHRCVLHLADGDLEALRRATEKASVDYRDVVLRAEHDATGTRMWNFHRTFDQAPEHPPK